ncbi:hypothetical protein HPB47_022369 [Ixodes persulcatus]|uniref:Uncharacterized protein n=1 Tax=Ixodes persulcatus TaxID=34615 RepID=A0AC60QC89_IXOPE|nr:hypothetical protein HPB47_022369 [Ixodes persulcatus]
MAPTVECAKCHKEIQADGKNLVCADCTSAYHLGKNCSGVGDSTFTTVGQAKREKLRAHTKCVCWPADVHEFLQSGVPSFTCASCGKISGGASPNHVAMASSDRRNVASLSHLSVSPSPTDAARPEKGAAVPAAIGGARSVASILDSRMHSRHQDKLNLDGGGFRETRPKLPRTRRPLLKGSASASGIPVAPPPSQPRRQRAVFVTRLVPNCDAASLQAHIEKSGTLSELACTRLKTRHDGYSSFHVTAAEQDIEKVFDPFSGQEEAVMESPTLASSKVHIDRPRYDDSFETTLQARSRGVESVRYTPTS